MNSVELLENVQGFEELEKAVDLSTPEAKAALKRLSDANARLVAAEMKRDDLAKEMESFDVNAQMKIAEEEAQAKVADSQFVMSTEAQFSCLKYP